MLSSSSDEEKNFTYYLYKKLVGKKKQEKIIEGNLGFILIFKEITSVDYELDVSARELQETDVKFVAFYRMSKESCKEIVDIISPTIYQKNTNMREYVSEEEISISI
jgi:hypothetical protein